MSATQQAPDSILSDPIYKEILEQLRPHAGADSVFAPDTVITEDLGMDSLAIMDFLFDLEDALDLNIPEHRTAEVRTIRDLVAAIVLLQKES
ncbi:MAG: acyl carrier protein [Robiginitomaculum sp.]|nr:MAG: acyl carrier protein [Robiginitomaculum sp.]